MIVHGATQAAAQTCVALAASGATNIAQDRSNYQ